MTDQNFENLCIKWPDLLSKSTISSIAKSDGWDNIIDKLCEYISADLERAVTNLNYARKNPSATFNNSLAELEAAVATELNNLPVITQITEKFGTLRVYTDGETDKVRNYINFAIGMSSCTCEICGAPGKPRSGSRISTLCNTHYNERCPVDNLDVVETKNTGPHFFDD